MSTLCSVSISEEEAHLQLANNLKNIVKNYKHNYTDIVIVCVGTDRSTGDSLGPLVGHFLENKLTNIRLYGTIDEPVHALNIYDKLDIINKLYKNPLVLAVDACLGKEDNVEKILLQEGALRPGAAVNKDLPSFGDYTIKGIVNVGGYMETIVLQSTRLSRVMKMAKVISSAIIEVDESLSPKEKVSIVKKFLQYFKK